jgi:hypothetical protein
MSSRQNSCHRQRRRALPGCQFVRVHPILPHRGEKRQERKYKMRILAASVFALGLGLMSMSAQAMPLAPIDQSAASREIIHVAQGCGPGFHRGPAGACRPLYNCPPGWHTGPYGKKCFRN